MKHTSLVVVVTTVCLILSSACTANEPTSPKAAGSKSPTASNPSATQSPDVVTSGPLRDDEITWLQDTENLLERLDLEESRTSGVVTQQTAKQSAAVLRKCVPESAKIGAPPTTRLIPLATLLAEICQLSEREAGCHDAMAKLPDSLVEERDIRKGTEVGACISAAGIERLQKRASFQSESLKLKVEV